MSKNTAKRFPELASDAAAEAFVAEADLTDFDWSDMKGVRFEFAAKDARINMRLPADLLAAVKRRAEQEWIPYQRFIRRALEGAVGKVG
jgi:predicted DNA binding CopG/RHH family protein